MKFLIHLSLLIPLALILTGCGGGRAYGAGYWFHFIFIVIPLIVIGILLLKRAENSSESFFTIEGQLRRLASRIENLEEKVKELSESGSSKQDGSEKKKQKD